MNVFIILLLSLSLFVPGICAQDPPVPSSPFYVLPQDVQVTIHYTNVKNLEQSKKDGKTEAATRKVVSVFGTNEQHSILYSNGTTTEFYVLSEILFHRHPKTKEPMMDYMPKSSLRELLTNALGKISINNYVGVRDLLGQRCFVFEYPESLSAASTASEFQALPKEIRDSLDKDSIDRESKERASQTFKKSIYISIDSKLPVAILNDGNGQIFEYSKLNEALSIPNDIRDMFNKNKKYFTR